MRIMAVSGLVLLTVLAAPAFGQSFVGEWTATAATPAGDVSETLTVVKTDTGYAITATLVAAVPEGALVITYTGVVSGDRFTGTVDLGGLAQAPYTGLRLKREAKEGKGGEHGR